MKPIELELWKPKQADPRYMERAGRRSAGEVFKELEQRLDSMGMLPDEYLLLDRDWQDGRLIPEGADIFITTDYGGSEGVYLDAYLKWYEDGKPVTKTFFTGKTLGETGADLDRMFLIASAITKAFHGYGRQPESGMVLCLNAEEKEELIEALIEKRERTLEQTDRVEKLLRRAAGSITAYMDTVGERPLRFSDMDKAVLAIRDGELEAFKELIPRVSERADELLGEAAGRTGAVGTKMAVCLLAEAEKISEDRLWMAEQLLKRGWKVRSDDYLSMDICMRNGAAGAAKHLLDQGMDYDQYRAWAEQHSRFDIDEQTANEVQQYWNDLHPQEQSEGAEQETPQLEGMTL